MSFLSYLRVKDLPNLRRILEENPEQRMNLLTHLSKTSYETLKIEFRSSEVQNILNNSLKLTFQNFLEFLIFSNNQSDKHNQTLGVTATLFIGKITNLVKDLNSESQYDINILTEPFILNEYLKFFNTNLDTENLPLAKKLLFNFVRLNSFYSNTLSTT